MCMGKSIQIALEPGWYFSHKTNLPLFKGLYHVDASVFLKTIEIFLKYSVHVSMAKVDYVIQNENSSLGKSIQIQSQSEIVHQEWFFWNNFLHRYNLNNVISQK